MRQYYYTVLLVLISTCFFTSVFAQETPLLLVGGGSEAKGGWSDVPYQWFVNQSSNKKVAIISYADVEDDWLKNYFISLGAVDAKDFKIDREASDNEQLMAELEDYTAFFFKGGDQNKYYTYYKNSAFHTFLSDKIEEGVVLGGTSAGMAILSSIVYTAERGSLYPEDGLTNMSAKYFTFKDDFLNVLPNTVVDTHFAERGRLVRLISMLAYLDLGNYPDNLLGIGVDDKTALCIDQDKIGTTYGTGAVSFLKLNNSHNIDATLPLQLQNTSVVSCIEGQKYDLNEKKKLTLENESTADNIDQYKNHVVLYGHAEYKEKVAEITTNTIVVTDGTSSIVEDELPENITILNTNKLENADWVTLKDKIIKSEEIVLLPFKSALLSEFKNEDSALHWVWESMKSSATKVHVFGDAISYIGSYYSSNAKTVSDAAYTGRLRYNEGLNILENTILTTSLFDQSDYTENTVALLQEGLIKQELNWSIGIPKGVELELIPSENHYTAQHRGPSSALLFENNSSGFSEANSNRNIIGYEEIISHVLYENSTILSTKNFKEYIPEFKDIISNLPSNDFGVDFRNNKLFFDQNTPKMIAVYDLQGRLLKNVTTNHTTVKLSDVDTPLLLIKIHEINSGHQHTFKIRRN